MLAIVVIIFLVTIIRPNESQVITRYTAYGIANFYRGHWYELFNYVALTVLVAIGHSLLSIKLARVHRRELALALLWVTIVILMILAILAHLIIKIASLG